MNILDMELKLLGGFPINVHGIPIYSIKLTDIIEKIGYTKYNMIVDILCIDDDLIKKYMNPNITGEYLFWYIYDTFYRKTEFYEELTTDDVLKYFKILFKTDVVFNENLGFVVNGKFAINNKNYYEFQNIIKYRNCLNDIGNINDDNPADERTKKLIEKRNKLRKKVQKQKSESDDPLTMADLISIFSEAEHMIISDVCDNYDIYQFNNQFNRLKIMGDFHVNIQALLAGAKSEEEPKHWLSKIDAQN